MRIPPAYIDKPEIELIAQELSNALRLGLETRRAHRLSIRGLHLLRKRCEHLIAHAESLVHIARERGVLIHPCDQLARMSIDPRLGQISQGHVRHIARTPEHLRQLWRKRNG